MTNIFDDESFTSEHTVNLLNKGFIDGFVDASDHSSTAVGAGAVSAAGGAVVNAATGLGAVANAGHGTVNQASGHAQIVHGSSIGQNVSHSPGAITVGHDASGAFNSGAIHGVQAGGSAVGNVVGHGNETATVLGNANGSAFGFGHSVAGAASGNAVYGDAALSGVGGAQNQSHLTADHGSAIGGHDAVGHYAEDHHLDLHETNLTHIEDSTNVTTAQGHSFAQGHQHFAPTHVEIDHSQLAGDDINDINAFFHH